MAAGKLGWIINGIRHRRKKDTIRKIDIKVARYDLDVVEIQNNIIGDLSEVNKRLLEELENYRAMEDEDRQLQMMMEDIEEGKKDLMQMLEP